MSYFSSMSLKDVSSEIRDCSNLRHLGQGESIEEKLVFAKPQRVALAMFRSAEFINPMRQLRSTSPAAVDGGDAGCEILEVFLSKNSFADAQNFGCSPPYFSGSPPSRASNPLVRDAEFSQMAAWPSASPQSRGASVSPQSAVSPVPSLRARARASPSIRIEGFECSGHGFDCTKRGAGRRVPAIA